MVPIRAFESTTGPRPRRLLGGIAVSAAAHAIVALLLVFDVLGPGGAFGLGIGPGFGIGAGGGAGLGEARRREIFSLQDLPTPTPPSEPTPDKTLHELLVPFFFSSRRRHTRWNCDWSSDVCSSDLGSLAKSTSPTFCPRVLKAGKAQEYFLTRSAEVRR